MDTKPVGRIGNALGAALPAFALLISCSCGSGKGLEERTLEMKHTHEDLVSSVKVMIPAGWKPYREWPAKFHAPAEDISESAHIGFYLVCGNFTEPQFADRYMDRQIIKLKDQLKRPFVGSPDPKLETYRADVAVLSQGNLKKGGRYVVCKVTYPDPPERRKEYLKPYFFGRSLRYQEGVPCMIKTDAQAPLSEKKKSWSLLKKALKSTDFSE